MSPEDRALYTAHCKACLCKAIEKTLATEEQLWIYNAVSAGFQAGRDTQDDYWTEVRRLGPETSSEALACVN